MFIIACIGVIQIFAAILCPFVTCSNVPAISFHSILINLQYNFQNLRIPDSYDANIVKICNLWTFWPVIQLISPLFKIRQKDGLLAELQATTSKSCRFLLFWHHNYQVSLNDKHFLQMVLSTRN